MKRLINVLVAILYGFLLIQTNAQELPPIQVYNPIDYKGDNQNWGISQSKDKTIYIANNNGLLVFNGENWQTYATPNETIMRSVHVSSDTIYTGCYMEFGYWTKNEFGTLSYNSLSEKLTTPLLEEEQFWKIMDLKDWILFQSLNRIYIYNTLNKSFKIISSDTGITKMYKINESVYFQKANQGLYKIESGKDVLISNDPIVSNNRLINVFQHKDGLLIETQDNGLFIFKNGDFSIWNNELNTLLKTKSVYNSLKLKNGHYALGTISHGLMVIDETGKLIYNIDQNQGIGNNTILCLYEDLEKNLWLGSDNGITCLNMQAPLLVYNDDDGLIGSVYASAIFNKKLFIGTNQGLFYKDLYGEKDFEFIEGTQGQVWHLTQYKDQLFCGHNSGTFLIQNSQATKISHIEGTWVIKPVQGKPNKLIQGNYDGLYVLEKVAGNWIIKNKISGFDISSRFIEFTDDGHLLVSHEYKGIIKLKLNLELTKVENIEIDDQIKGLKSSLAKYNNQLFYAFENGIYKNTKKGFEKDSLLSKTFANNSFVSGKLISDSMNNRLWNFTNDQINYIEPGDLSSEPIINSIPLPYQLIKSVGGYENLLPIDANNYLIGTASGYLMMNLEKVENKNYITSISGISNTKDRSKKNQNNVSLNSKGVFSNEEHNIEIMYTIYDYDKYFKSEYQYQLLGLYDDWSSWSSESMQLFENLPYGDYTFNVRGKINNKITQNVASYSFRVERPWYLSNFMIAQYIIGILLFSLLMHFVYKSYYKKQRQQLLDQKNKEIELKELANQEQSMRFKNEKLEQDIENKNRELAISTMSLIKKNEFLNSIKNELTHIKDNSDVKPVVKIIDKNLNNTDDWKLFQEAFNNADKDFLKKVKSIHPSLTPNDLRLCAYLRLNLSSKEIAPLLNISPRSVEVKRYRLRKKMNLPHESSLTNYIIEL